jgi:hypothetical protein
MDTNITTSVGDLLVALPPQGVERELALLKATELAATREASSALQSAAVRAREALRKAPETSETDPSRVIADALAAASEVFRGGTSPSIDAARGELRRAVSSRLFLDVVREWIVELRAVASTRPTTGACTAASGMQLWLWTMSYFRRGPERREAVVAELADAFCALIATRCQILAVAAGPHTSVPQDLAINLSHVHAARAAGAVAALCAEVVHGYRRHPVWDAEGCAGCYGANELDELEGLMPGIASAARTHSDVIEADGAHAPKAGPCVRLNDIEGFTRLRAKLDGCLTGARLAKDRAAAVLSDALAPAPPTRS